MDKIYIYNQNCTGAGQAVSQAVIDDYDGDPDDAGDWTAYTADDLAGAAQRAERAGADGGYSARVVQTIREALGL